MLHSAVSVEVDCSGPDPTLKFKSSWAQAKWACSPCLHWKLWPPLPSAGVSGDFQKAGTLQPSMGNLRSRVAGLPA